MRELGISGIQLCFCHDNIAAYHKLFEVESSFRMAKYDLIARQIFNHKHKFIEAHLPIVFAELVISRIIQYRTGLSSKMYLRLLKLIRTGVLSINGALNKFHPLFDLEVRSALEAISSEMIK
ncbi:MAG: hypothetical protein FWH40_09210 [Coriobacteriia bacterium]|nr:hypothetical protein [Coriobacteriia bacterium]